MILEGEINLTGVHIPVLPEIYEPVLGELERLGIVCEEEKVARGVAPSCAKATRRAESHFINRTPLDTPPAIVRRCGA